MGTKRPYPTKDFSFADKARGPIGKSARLWRYKSMDWVAKIRFRKHIMLYCSAVHWGCAVAIHPSCSICQTDGVGHYCVDYFLRISDCRLANN